LVIRLKKFRVAVIGVLPVAAAPLTIVPTYSLLAKDGVIVITTNRFPFKQLKYNDKNDQPGYPIGG
jgi:hypothetical protein